MSSRFSGMDLETVGLTQASMAEKVTVVTGGGSGIGRALALLLAKLGAKVVIAEVETYGEKVAAEIRHAGGQALFIRTDWLTLRV